MADSQDVHLYGTIVGRMVRSSPTTVIFESSEAGMDRFWIGSRVLSANLPLGPRPSTPEAATAFFGGRYEEYVSWKVRGLPPKNAHVLNQWLHRQRCAARDGRLRAPLIAALENLERELQWIRDSEEQAQAAAAQTELAEHTKSWFSNFHRLAAWHSSHGSIPQREGGARERRLALLDSLREGSSL